MADTDQIPERVTENKAKEEKADDGTGPEPEPYKPPAPRFGTIWGVGYVKRKLHERRARREAQPPEQQAAHSTAVATWWIAIFTIVLALVGIFTLFEVISGGDDTKRQIATMRQQMSATAALAMSSKVQADNTANLAKSAGEQVTKLQMLATVSRGAVKVNREALEAQRAFITFQQGLGILPVSDNTTPPHYPVFDVSVRLENSGTTPTRGALHRMTWQFMTARLPDDFRFVDTGSDPTTPFIVGPKGVMSGATVAVPTTGPNGLEAVRNHTGHMVFWGWTTYRDIFESTPRHVTMFCLDLAEIRGQEVQSNTANQFIWRNCSGSGLRHNCADEDCNGEPYGNPTRIWPN